MGKMGFVLIRGAMHSEVFDLHDFFYWRSFVHRAMREVVSILADGESDESDAGVDLLLVRQ